MFVATYIRLVQLPLLFSGIMAANLLGAMLGGLLEYNSMKFGFQALYVLGIAVYGLAALSYFVSHKIRTVK